MQALLRKELEASAVSASVDMSPYFSRDGPSPSLEQFGRSAWHAVRVHHFCRPMGMPEACCERVGSIMQSNWSKQKGEDVGAIMDSVLLQECMLGVRCDVPACHRLFADYTTTISPVHNQYVTRPVYHKYINSISPAYHQYIASTSPVCHQHMTST